MTSNDGRELLERSRTELGAAKALAEGSFAAQALAHAYYAAFYSAEAALLGIGETRSKHSGVMSAFGRLVIKEGGFDPTIGMLLRHLFDLRHAATYDDMKVERKAAASAIADAETFVSAVERWLANRS